MLGTYKTALAIVSFFWTGPLGTSIIIRGKTLSKFLIKNYIAFRVTVWATAIEKSKSHAFPENPTDMRFSRFLTVSLCIWIMTTLPFQHILSSFFVFHIEVPAMHDPIPSIINITNKQLNNQLFQGQHFCFKDSVWWFYLLKINILTEWYPVIGGIDSGNKVIDCGKL